ncbi:MAG: LamG domain-containing protein, partial [Cyclobacteriaceae bacterium]
MFSSTLVLAQENCLNGVDDDDDGLIDCFDGDCALSTDCQDFFFGNPVVCGEDPQVQEFKIRTQWVSEDLTTNNGTLPTVGDIDFDGIPEIITTNHLVRSITVLNGATGETENQIVVNYDIARENAIGNIDDDDCGDIFVSQHNGRRIERYDCDLNLIYSVNASRNDNVGNMGLADFNEDGVAELYYRDEIMNAETGAIIVTGSNNDWDQNSVYGPVAVDMLADSECADCDGLELVVGNRIYAINIGAGTRTLAKDMNDFLPANMKYFPKYFDGWGGNNWSGVAVADFNEDGHMDALMSGAQGNDNEDRTTVFFWDVFNNTVLTYFDNSNNHSRGTGRINIADVDGDGGLNASYVSNQSLYSLALVPDGLGGEILDDIWIKSIAEGSSGFTGCSVFDFNDDGKAEIVYRSETSLLIVDGVSGITRVSLPCVSRTTTEYPIVADVDGDGASEICVACFTDNNFPFDPYDPNSSFGQIRVFEADEGENWQPSRSVWNQMSYFNVNVNDDLTIPIEMQNHTAVFSTDECTDGPNRALNTFLNQAPILEANGCPAFVTPELTILDDLTITSPQCPSANFEVTFTIQNTGDVELSGLLPVTFYDGNPAQSGSIRLNTEQTVIAALDLGETLELTMNVQGSGDDFEVFVSINDSGTKALPFSGDGDGPIAECGTQSNIANGPVVPTPFPLSVEKLKDNELCDGGKPNNGRARAYYEGALGGDVVAAWVESFGDLPNNDDPDTGETAWSATEATNTDYAGVDTNSGGKAFEANDTDGLVTWTSEVIDITGFETIDLSANMSASNSMETDVDFMIVTYKLDGGDTTLLDNGDGRGSFGSQIATATGLVGSTVQIVVYMNNTANNETYFLDNVRVSGTTAITVAEQTNGFTFYWFSGTKDDPSTFAKNADYEGALYPSMDEGTYSVFGINNAALCYSDTLEVTIDEVAAIFEDDDVIVTNVSDVTDCDDPDGALSAAVDDGNGGTTIEGYTFTWYVGNDFTAPIGVEASIDGLEARTYSVVVVDDLTGCQVVNTSSVNSSLTKPILDAATTVDVTDCADPDGGSASISRDGGTTNQSTFLWYDGTSIKAEEDHEGATYPDLTPGFYTVEVYNNQSGCVSDPITVEILDLTGSPNPEVTEIAQNTGCEIGTGILQADGENTDVGLTTTGYTFEWFAGHNTLNQYKLPNANDSGTPQAGSPWILEQALGGNYTVRVTRDSDGCQTTIFAELTNDFEEPTFNFIQDIGAGKALVLDDKAHILVPDENGNVNNNLTAGWDAITISYWAFVTPENYTNDHRIFSSGGTGESQVLLWTDNHDGLAFVVKTENDGGRGRINSSYSATGWIHITGTWDQSTGDMRLYVNGVLLGVDNYVGSGEGIVDTGNPVYFGRDGNLGSKKFTGVLDELRIYDKALTAEEVVAGVCQPLVGNEDGLVVYYNFDELPDDLGSQDFGEFEVLDVSNLTTVIDGRIVKPGNSPGTASVQESNITCPIGGVKNNTSCDPDNPNGVIDMTGLVDPQGADFLYTLYEGYSIGTLVDENDITEDNPNTLGTFSGLAGGFYTLIVEDQTTGCQTQAAVLSLSDISDFPNIVSQVDNDISCNNLGLGAITITTSSNNGEPVSGYRYEIFNGANTDLANRIENVVVADGSIGYVFDSLSDGQYRVQVTNLDETCQNTADILIDDISINPVIRSTRLSPNTSCGDSNNGVVTVSGINDIGIVYPNDPNVEDAIEMDDAFNFAWFSGSLVDSTLLIRRVDNSPYDSVSLDLSKAIVPGGFPSDGKYTVVAFSDSTGCFSSPTTRTIQNLPVFPDVFTNQESANTSCNATFADGQASAYVIDPLFVDPTDPAGWLFEEDGYVFEWYDNNTDVSPADGLIDGAPLDTGDTTTVGLASDTYYVQVTNTNSGCVTIANITIGSMPTQPAIALNGNSTDNTACGANVNGSIEVNISLDGNPVIDFTGYTFTWYEGTGTAGAEYFPAGDASTNGSSPNVDPLNPNIIGGLAGNESYTLVVIGANGCTSDEFVHTVGDNPSLPSATLNPIGAVDSESMNNTVCDTTFTTGTNTFNGALQLTPDAGVADDYDFTWFFGASTDNADLLITRLPNANIEPGTTQGDSLAQNLSGGVYTVIMQDRTSLCADTLEFTVPDVPDPDPAIDSSPAGLTVDYNITPNSDCGSSPNGGIEIIQVNGAAVTTDFYFLWYSGSDTSGTGNELSGLVNGDSSTVLSGQPMGNYTVVAIDGTTGCASVPETLSITEVPDRPDFEVAAIGAGTENNSVCNADLATGDFNGQITVNP